ncbi:MAG: dTDP-4-dehydrorhamnose 3,5-epimerase [Chthoniobacterales bacterium]|nr:dTDP-4-dehydrorhamnose 3,5-epimerase [Chthoniobacterales bacterium]
MHIEQTKLNCVLLIKPRVFRDDRGFFIESWNKRVFDEAVGRNVEFVQDNHSRSAKGVLRGLHFQAEPMAQAKLITVMRGRIFDVAVDIRPNAPTFGQWVGEVLTDESREILWIPEGFAHGFYVLSDFADVVYKTTNYYSPEHERCIRWDDETLAVKWPLTGEPVVSGKDREGEGFGIRG